MKKNEKWIYDDNGNLKQINCQVKKDKFCNEKKLYKESLTSETIFLLICGIAFFIGGITFWNAFFKFAGVDA